MALMDDIRSATQGVVASGVLAEAWSYRQRTSSPTTTPATYGSWTAFYALVTAKRFDDDYNDAHQTMMRRESASLRWSDAGPALKMGDQVKDASNVVWTIDAQESGAAGTVRFRIVRDIASKSQPARNGGLTA